MNGGSDARSIWDALLIEFPNHPLGLCRGILQETFEPLNLIPWYFCSFPADAGEDSTVWCAAVMRRETWLDNARHVAGSRKNMGKNPEADTDDTLW